MSSNTFNLVLNSKNAVSNVGNQPNVFQYNFPSGSFTVPEGAEMAISQITLPYSWRNVTSALGNNKFSYYIPNSSNVQTKYDVTLADGFYTLTDIQTALQAVMKTNGHYWFNTQSAYLQQFQFTGTITGTTLTIDSSFRQIQLYVGYDVSYIATGGTSYTQAVISAVGPSGTGTYTLASATGNCLTGTAIQVQTTSEITPTIIYPINLTSNAVLYANNIQSYTIPTSANLQSIFGAGWVYANGTNGQPTWTGNYPTSGNQFAYLVFPSTTSTTTTIGNILGFSSDGTTSYPTAGTSTTASQNVNSNGLSTQPPFPPKGSSVNGVIVHCNIVNNFINSYTDVLDCIPIQGTNYGSNIVFLPISDNWIQVRAGKYSNFQISFTDDNYNTLYMLDQNVLISLLFRFPEKK
jgi:hypothetical protein